jgi:hypothetical protein
MIGLDVSVIGVATLSTSCSELMLPRLSGVMDRSSSSDPLPADPPPIDLHTKILTHSFILYSI